MESPYFFAKYFFYSLVVSMFCSLTAFAGEMDQVEEKLNEPVIERLELPGGCTNAVDKDTHRYKVDVSGMADSDQLRFLVKGGSSRAQSYTVGELRKSDIHLKPMTLLGSKRKNWEKNGLWVQHVPSKKKTQLNNLPGNYMCNTKGLVRVKYADVWITAK